MRHLLLALMCATTAYLSALLFLAPYSQSGYRQLVSQRDALSASVEDLRLRQAELTARAEALRTSGATVEVLARAQELYDPDARVVRLIPAVTTRSSMSPGAVVRPAPAPVQRRGDALLMAAAAAIIGFALSVIVARPQSETIERTSK